MFSGIYRPCKVTAFGVTRSIIETCVGQVVHGKGLTDIFQGRVALQQGKTAGSSTSQLKVEGSTEIKRECMNCALLCRFVLLLGMIRKQ